MKIEPKLNYFSIWGATFRLFRRHFRMLLAMLLLAAPFFILAGLANAYQMMAFGSAAMSGAELPPETMRLLWLALVGGDSLAFIALAIGTLVLYKSLSGAQATSFRAQLREQFPRIVKSGSFWIFVVLQIVAFGMINSPQGPYKLSGMVVFAISVLWFLSGQDRESPVYGKLLQQLNWKGWLNLILVLLTFPLFFILLNGYINYFVLMLFDLGALQIVHLFPAGSPAVPFAVITISKFFSQWFNILLMGFLLCTYLAMRGTTASEQSFPEILPDHP
jgi:hypothetical protein